MQENTKLLALLDTVIDCYLDKWEPVWSKFLNSLEAVDYAPSTLRKYLNALEKQWMVYQPYNSSWRIPTVDWLKLYIENYLQQMDDMQSLEVDNEQDNKTLETFVGEIKEVSNDKDLLNIYKITAEIINNTKAYIIKNVSDSL